MPNRQQLQEWYKQFSKVLKDEAGIDVTLPAALGRVKNIEITKWDTTNPDKPDIQISYAYASGKGNKPATPFSETASKADHEKWLTQNLKPAVTDEQILRLYNMSREGTLMISDIREGISDMQMVRTKPDGTITVSLPASMYRNGKNETLPEDDQLPQKPEKPDYSLDPTEYGIPPKPVAPKEPANMNPSIWSLIANWLFGVDNDYAKLRQYDMDKIAYNKAIAKWEHDVEHAENRVVTDEATGQERTIDYEEFRIARNAHEMYSEQLAHYQSNSLAKFNAIADSANALMDKNFWRFERDSVKFNFETTPIGKAKDQLDFLNEKLTFEERTDVFLHNWWGHDADPTKVRQYFGFELGDLQVKPLELPKSPNFNQMTAADQAAHSKYMSDLFDLTALSSLMDPEITAKNPKSGRTPIDEARNRFGHILNDMITSGRPNSREYFRFIDPIREKTMDVLTAYNQGEKGPLAAVLAQGMRQLLLAGHNLEKFTDHVLNTPYVIGKMYNLLQQDKDLLQATGLTEEEMRDAESHMELYRILHQGIQSKKDILDHALEKRTLTAEQLQKAAADVLLFHHVTLGVADGNKQNEKAMYAGEEYQRLANSLTRPKIENGKQAYNADGTPIMEPVDAVTFNKISKRLEAIGEELPINQFTMGLLNKDGVQQYMQGLMEKSNLSNVGEMSREQLRDLFSKSNDQIATTIMASSKLDLAPKNDAPDVQAQIQESQLQEQNPILMP